MRKFLLTIVYVDISNGNWWSELVSYRAWTYDKAVKKALWRGQSVLRGLNATNKDIYMRVCKYRPDFQLVEEVEKNDYCK